jgi:hypothetical protein
VARRSSPPSASRLQVVMASPSPAKSSFSAMAASKFTPGRAGVDFRPNLIFSAVATVNHIVR